MEMTTIEAEELNLDNYGMILHFDNTNIHLHCAKPCKLSIS